MATDKNRVTNWSVYPSKAPLSSAQQPQTALANSRVGQVGSPATSTSRKCSVLATRTMRETVRPAAADSLWLPWVATQQYKEAVAAICNTNAANKQTQQWHKRGHGTLVGSPTGNSRMLSRWECVAQQPCWPHPSRTSTAHPLPPSPAPALRAKQVYQRQQENQPMQTLQQTDLHPWTCAPLLDPPAADFCSQST